jgi:predicted nuclease of predicted toxin-antitoxin system
MEAGMNGSPKVMVLIDADNVTADVIEQALERAVELHGAAHIRRAYCTAEAAAKQLKLFKKLSIRPMVNIASGKNCTDIALSIDAIDLAIAERPDVAVIVSSDSDFAPLVLRLREKGCRVEGIGQEGKTSDDTKLVYDAFVDLPHRKVKAARPAAKAARAPRPHAAAAKPPPAPPPLPDEVRDILHAMPELARGEPVPLRVAAEPLRRAGLLSKNAASTKVFRKHPQLFHLEPEKQPSKVRFLGGAAP